MRKKVEHFAEEFKKFILCNDRSVNAEIILSKKNGKWLLSYSDKNDKRCEQEFSTPLFLSSCSFYPAMNLMLKEMDKKIDCENFQISIQCNEKYRTHFTINAIENICDYEEERDYE